MTTRPAKSPAPIAAFFDLDGTLFPAPSLEWRFFTYLLARGEIRPRQIARWLARSAARCIFDLRHAIESNKSYLAGLPESLIADWESSLIPGSLAPFSRGLRRIRWHLAQRHQIFFITGTLDPLARVASRNVAGCLDGPSALAFSAQIEICAAQLEIRSSHWTGNLANVHCSGEAKARSIRALAAKHSLDLSNCFAYGNAIADLPMLESVGNPLAVNPSSRLERAARIRGWQSQDWREISVPPRSNRRSSAAPCLSPKGAR
jgi:alcohol-forming fatty acyl-CoA reductase